MAKARVRILAREELAQHRSEESCWVVLDRNVYDVTSFLKAHPGGDGYILGAAGPDDIRSTMEEYKHTPKAYDLLQSLPFKGHLGAGEVTVSDDWEATDDFKPGETDQVADFEQNEFLDLRKPLAMQMWRNNFSKAYYLQQVHQPRHLAQTARLFGPWYLEMFTRTTWYTIPLIWLPIASYIFLRGTLQFGAIPLPPFRTSPALPLSLLTALPASAYAKAALSFVFGNFVWTLLEYIFHRFLFHLDYYLPDNNVFLTLHFLMHGIHHYMPMDPLRLVMPPTLFVALSYPMTQLAHLLFPASMANCTIAGSFTFYVLYDCMHYALHHTRLPAYVREMKRYHLAHHYKNFELGFGVTSKIWDYVFNTLLVV
ncbi:fatty acid-2 hydroxylase [Vararia minispora EC-137]|uniref:Fatty acid-2 hydroxylase n=1 Tax=Vararia minispora EC-137 TaxID=1314806 RepID=A0ACB8QZ22_9AGAM|nr:fatty acid-2 hydroxylase [Vararia minispora EC-137]